VDYLINCCQKLNKNIEVIPTVIKTDYIKAQKELDKITRFKYEKKAEYRTLNSIKRVIKPVLIIYLSVLILILFAIFFALLYFVIFKPYV